MRCLCTVTACENSKHENFRMTSNALRVVPVVDGVGDVSSGNQGSCSFVCVNNDNIFVGYANGSVGCYKVSSQLQSVTIPTVSFLKSVDLGTKKPVVSLVSVGSSVVALSNECAFAFSVSTSSPATLLYKGACALTIQEQSGKTAEYPPVAVSTYKRRLIIFGHTSSGYVQDPNEISTGTDTVSKLVWFNQWIVGASSRSYISVSAAGDRSVRDIFPVDTTACIAVLKSSNEVLLVGQDGLGIFMNVQSEGLTPAPRNTVTISHHDASICVLGTYLVSLSSQEGVVDVFSLTSNDSKLIQTINLPSSGIACSNSFSTSAGLPVVAGSVLYLLITVPYDSQLKKLVEAGKLEEALEMVNYQFPPSAERDRALKDFHRQVGWKLFNQGDYSVAFVHFGLGLSTASDLDPLFKRWESAPESLKTANEAMTSFLKNIRASIARTDAELKTRTESLLIVLLSGSELVDFIKSGLSLSLDEAKTVLASKSPVGLALILEQHGQLVDAIQILESTLPGSQRELIETLTRNFADLPLAVITAAVQRLAHVDAEGLVPLIVRMNDPIILIDSVDGSKKCVLEALEILAAGNEAALSRLITIAVKANDFETVSSLVLKHKLTSLPELDGVPEAIFTRMLLLGNEGNHRNALLLSSDLGEQYIARVADSLSMKGNLLVLLASVLFESNQYAKACKILLTHETDLQCVKVSLLIETIPSNLRLDRDMIEFLKRLNRRHRNAARDATIAENLQSFRFLNTFSEWSAFRQSKPVLVTEESACSICGLEISAKLQSVAVLPSSAVVHPSCLDSAALRTDPSQ